MVYHQGSSLDRALHHDDMNAVRELLEAIARSGLHEQYIRRLGIMETSAAYEDDRESYGWELLRATPEQHARAFMAVLNDAARA